jgi:hypothetical protein
MKCYKLTDQNRWTGNRWYETSGEGDLGGPGWLNAYSHLLVALMLNPNIKNPRLFEARGSGKFCDDRGLKCGFTRLRLVRELPVPDITVTQRVAFGILCGKEVCDDAAWNEWADGWLSGQDRSSASAAYAYAYAAAASAAADYAAYAAAYAAHTKGDICWAAIAERAMEVQ